MVNKVIVIGGGAAGLMAAGRAANLGADVILLEKMPHVGTKLSITGKGRCNLTSSEGLDKFLEAFGHTGKFLINVFSRFFSEDLINFFESLGVRTAISRGKRVFPLSGSAKDVVRALVVYLNKHGVKISTDTSAEGIIIQGNRAVGVNTNKGAFYGDAVILATGGASYPKTGSSGDGYRIAEKIGHTIIPIRPALVPLEAKDAYVKDLQGLTLKNVSAAVYLNNRKVREEFGEILFTHFGLSGPLTLTISKTVADSLSKGRVEVSIDLKPALTMEVLDRRLLREIRQHSNKNLDNLLKNLLPQSMIPFFINRTGIPPDKKTHQIAQRERIKIASLLKDMRFSITRTRPLGEAIVTAGGVSTNEIDPRTMESKIIKDLYICGEIIDVDAKTGGYNLQAAFSTGWVAGTMAASKDARGSLPA